MALDSVVQRVGGGMGAGGGKEEGGGITIMTADVAVGIFIGMLQFFAANGNGGGGGCCVLFQGLVFCFWFWFFYWVRWGILVAVVVVAGFLRPGPSSMDDHADGKVELLQGGWC